SAPWRAARRRPLLHGTVALVAAAYFVGRGLVAPMTHHPDLWGGSRLANTATALGTLPKYVQLLVFPRTLMADYSPDAYPIQTTPLAPLPLLGIAIVLAIIIGAAATARRSPAASLGIAWFGIALLPVMHVIPHHELMAEHYLYLPSVGAFIAAGAGLMRLRRWSPIVAAAIAALALVPLGMRTLVRNFDWRDARTLWEAQLAATDDCARAHYNHATVILHEGGDDPEELRRAERHLRRAYEIQAKTRAGVSRVPGNEIVARLGSIAVRLGRTEEGLPMLRAALAREMRGSPGPETAETLRNAVVTVLNAGGAGADERGRAMLIETLPALDRWVEIAPAEVEVRRMRGRTRHLLCDTAGARADYAAMVRLGAPGASLEGWEMTVESLLEEGDVGGAGGLDGAPS
ncbi:MAG: hypothetical protein QME96_18380, partial [Myxococcota bacterium]|nr:hypothetical protein [Myxococcota bacterium]